VGLLLNEVGVLLTWDIAKPEVFNAYFASVFIYQDWEGSGQIALIG